MSLPRSFNVLGIGSSMMTQASTGVGALQKPLRELYTRHKSPADKTPPIEQIIEISPDGT